MRTDRRTCDSLPSSDIGGADRRSESTRTRSPHRSRSTAVKCPSRLDELDNQIAAITRDRRIPPCTSECEWKQVNRASVRRSLPPSRRWSVRRWNDPSRRTARPTALTDRPISRGRSYATTEQSAAAKKEGRASAATAASSRPLTDAGLLMEAFQHLVQLVQLVQRQPRKRYERDQRRTG